MAHFYIKVPHYIDSYFRNRDENRKIKPLDAVKFESYEPLFHIISDSILLNNNNTIVRRGCFSEQQWLRMKRGFYIHNTQENKTPHNQKIRRNFSDDLTNEEISTLSGLNTAERAGLSAYLCVRMPKDVIIAGIRHRTSPLWQPKMSGAERIRKAMSDEFWRALLLFVNRHRDYSLATHGRNIILPETIERFMMRYDIYNSPENKELLAINRNYHRKAKSLKFSIDEVIVFG